MQAYQTAFIEFCLANGVLKFGEFKLKSGRISPYFFNAGLFKTGKAFAQLAEFYAAAINEHFKPSEYDLLFGPAYKGITLATAASIGLANLGLDIPVCFNRKEVKDHGEGGLMIGEPLKGKRALLIDDVVTAGTTIRDSVAIAAREGGALAGIVIALDRQEHGLASKQSAIQEVEQTYHLRVAHIITRDDLLAYLQQTPALKQHVAAMLEYKAKYGV